ncbi:WD40-repeat-containing domain protein [Scheffersomyces xylosifermentans]|uniref:WD40-repeat-containing domain protein n=1 Tax=Scheffersomyces xylosifermentans TaxID=1304137 RepID=UPI00315D6F08
MDIHRCRFVDYTPHTITATAFSHVSSLSKTTSNDLRLAVGRSNGDIEIWNPKYNWTHELTLPGARGRTVEGLCWSVVDNETPRLFSVGGSTYITEWDLATGKPMTNYDCNAGIIWSMAINSKQDKLAVGCDDGSVVIVDISGGLGSLEHDLICQRQDARILSIEWYANEVLVGGCADGRIRSWSASGETKGRILATMRVDKSKTESTLVWAISILPNKKQIVSGDSTGSVKFWDLEHFSLLQSFKVHDADVLSIAHDVNEEKIFTAGVDRKIHQFNLITSKASSSSKWVHSFNRLLHSNDIRSMSIFESKGYNFLVSGGVERSIVIQSVQHFQDGKYKKLLINQQKSNVVVNQNKKLIALWQDQSVKIWKIQQEDSKHKLVSKLNLADDENITSIDINESGDLLVVARLTSVRVFKLEESDKGKIKVVKFRDEEFDSLIEGAKQVKFYGNSKFLILTPNEEIYKFNIDTDNSRISLDDEIETIDSSKKGRLQYSGCINNWTVSPNSETLVLSRFNGSIEAYPLQDDQSEEPYLVTKLSSYPHLLQFSGDNKVVIVTEDNKLYEFHIEKSNSHGNNTLLTSWSKRNSEFLPQQFLSLDDKPQGLFIKDSKVWVYGSTWLSFFDLSVNIPINKQFKNTSNSKKRNRDGLTINEDIAEEEDVDGNLDILDESAEILELSLKQSQIDRLRQKIQDDESATSNGDSKRPFWLTTKYRPIVKVEVLGDEDIVLIERPQFSLPSTPAFNLPKLKI